MNAAMWEAVAAVRLPRGGPKVPTYENLLSRVKSLEKRVGAIERALALRPAKPAGRVYTVRAGDTLSAIAERFGLTWQALHEANRGTIGPDPNVIVPGQVLRLPE
ncbi:MAG: LysM peptidoglycan-binding domain-containing protein [Chloroflexi bacterium]|nr:LysM peptidoglycan-binding domain-containing protein [Chloroflexota bacterium]